jgi:lysophospholipase L1-like esterase
LYPFRQYEQEFEFLLQKAILFAGNRPGRVFVVGIPDYGITPFGKEKDPEKIDRELKRYNAKAKEIAEDYGVLFVDIYDISKKAGDQSNLTAHDKLHPSPEMYKMWVEKILEEIKSLLTDLE